MLPVQSGQHMATFSGMLGGMKAERLVATLLLLQARTRLTAAELAEELEVSERTARRDLEALSASGVPVYAQPGRNGGWALLGGARTDLSGLTAAEARALFLVAGPSAATPEVKAALRKLVRALPATFRASAEAAASAVLVDSAGWDRERVPATSPPHLETLRNAVIDGVQVRIAYTARDRTDGERVVHPLGLVAKGRVWYLLANTAGGLRTFRVDRVRSVEVTAEPVDRPIDFDLEATWQSVMAGLDEQRLPFSATVQADESFVPVLRSVLGTQVTPTGRGVRGRGRVEVTVRGHSAEMVARQLAGFGSHVRVIGPPEVCAQLARIGDELSGRYGQRLP
jgi:predicted DNA-binding transcriptional regulator YafY